MWQKNSKVSCTNFDKHKKKIISSFVSHLQVFFIEIYSVFWSFLKWKGDYLYFFFCSFSDKISALSKHTFNQCNKRIGLSTTFLFSFVFLLLREIHFNFLATAFESFACINKKWLTDLVSWNYFSFFFTSNYLKVLFLFLYFLFLGLNIFREMKIRIGIVCAFREIRAETISWNEANKRFRFWLHFWCDKSETLIVWCVSS